jgi:hypothetical protein
METIPYRNTKLIVKTIPKGTLLFRLSPNVENDLRGVLKSDGTRCIVPNHNVFFYPNPFVAKIALGIFIKNYEGMKIFILNRDVKVLWLLNPSKYSRVTKNTKRNFIKRCDPKKSGCLPVRNTGMLAKYNVCLSDTLIKKYPDIVGSIALSVGDAGRITEAVRNKTLRNRKYYHFADDHAGIHSIPELVLHPLPRRPSEDVIVKPEDEVETNYSLLKRVNVNDYSKLVKFMEDHAVYDPETFFYRYKE